MTTTAPVFYSGAHHPGWLNHHPSAPLFVSANTLARYRSDEERWPIATGTRWAGDSGAYAALMLAKNADTNPWSWDPDSYGGLWARICQQSGRMPDFVAVQDWPCEPGVRAATGFDVATHQELTVDSYRWLTREFPWIPWLPILQGWELPDYLRHVALYRAAGFDLTAAPLVGVGSVCRRGSQRSVALIVGAMADAGLRIHAFGASINALRLIGHRIASSDSMAWSAVARREGVRMDGCAHPGDCRNCHRWAMAYRDRATAAIGESYLPSGSQCQLPLWG